MSADREYLKCVNEILKRGHLSANRTGTDTLSKFGMQMRFDLRDKRVPILTTKKVNVDTVIKELVWFLSGSTDVTQLQAMGVHIWDANVEANGGEAGPIYGAQWRRYGTVRSDHCNVDCHCIETLQVDQISQIISQLIEDPTSRRIILCAWNPLDIDKMCLPPCHCFAQFLVHDGKLTCLLTQRSGDFGLGVPFNITSYAILTHLIAHVTNLEAYELVHTVNSAHVYVNHIPALLRQTKREPIDCEPIISIGEIDKSLLHLSPDQIQIEGYECHKRLRMMMAV